MTSTALPLQDLPTPASTDPSRELPGDLAMWALILMELTVFALFFLGFAVTQALNPEMFSTGKASLHTTIGLICTLSLITSGYLAALATLKIKQQKPKQTAFLLYGALAVACIYVIAKILEYIQLGNAGFHLSSNTFYTLYFFTTFFHLLHVVLGMFILGYMARRARQGAYADGAYDGFESGVSYWHMVDLVWIILFPIIYVIY